MSYYGTVALFKTYNTDRGRTISTSWSDANIEAALLVCSEWIDNVYESIFIGYKTDGYTQERSWPRTNAQVQVYPYYVYSTTEIPDKVTNAVYELTFKYLTDSTILDKDYTPNKYRSVTVQGAVSVDYDSSLRVSDIQTKFSIIQKIMNDLIDPNAVGSYSPLSGSLGRG